MSALRDEIRAILREEIAALRAPAGGTEVERVRIGSSADLNRFAQDLVRRAAQPDFAERVAAGRLSFALAETAAPRGTIVTAPPRPTGETLDKTLITERDIAGLNGAQRTVRIARQSRLTPLARDEARRRGIRIERADQ